MRDNIADAGKEAAAVVVKRLAGNLEKEVYFF